MHQALDAHKVLQAHDLGNELDQMAGGEGPERVKGQIGHTLPDHRLWRSISRAFQCCLSVFRVYTIPVDNRRFSVKHTPHHNAAVLNLHAPAMQISGSVDQKVEQLRKMFAQRSTRTKDDGQRHGDSEKEYHEG